MPFVVKLYFDSSTEASIRGALYSFSLKTTDKAERNDELRPEYNETLLKNGIRGKYAKQ